MDCSQVKYPIYVISKGRAYNPSTARNFVKHNVIFKLIVEPQEYDDYARVIPKRFIEILPFSNLGLGSFPARNFCWEQSLANGHERHFIFDDNIPSFGRLNYGKRTSGNDPKEAMSHLASFSDRFSNVGISGFNYACFVNKETKKPFYLNTHVYSGMLINNRLPFRWRLKYNEDVDLCLNALHRGWCTILFNAFLIRKRSTTEKHPGGNQTELYQNNDPKKKALKSYSLQQIWPQYAKVVQRFGRTHHFVDWKKHFKHPLIKKAIHGQT